MFDRRRLWQLKSRPHVRRRAEMKNRIVPMAAVTIVALLGLCGVLLTGCGREEDSWSGGGAALPSQDDTNQPPVSINTNTVSTNTVNTSTNDSYSGAFISGSSARTVDGYSGIYTFVNGMDVRLTVNDGSKTPGVVNGAYNLQPSLVDETDAFTFQGNVFTAKSFTSSRTHMKYRFMGWAIKSSSAPLTLQSPLTLTSFSGTLRAYWATVE